jgi:predicted nucleic acid-binding protein
MTLIDTSSWVQAMREKGDRATKSRVADLLDHGAAAWCNIVRVELWNGIGDSREKKLMRQFELDLPVLPIDERVWEDAVGLAIASRSHSLTVPAADLVVFACARAHNVEIEYYDKHFELLLRLG